MINFFSSKGSSPFAGNQRPVPTRFILLLSAVIVFSLLLSWRTISHHQPTVTSSSPPSKPEEWELLPEDELATRYWPKIIMSKPLASGPELYTIPQYIHQSWSDDHLPTRMTRWSQTCRNLHQHWDWVLWTDKDNLNMVQTYFPWFLKSYKALPAEINRADAARNMYMYLFGGVYADLDTECLQPFDKLFSHHNVALNGHPLYTPNKALGSENHQTAFFGSMGYDGTDNTLEHTIPNAWFAATPGHPFFLFVLDRLNTAMSSYFGRPNSAEGLTGPVALYEAIKAYNQSIHNGVANMDLTSNPSYNLFDRSSQKVRMEVLPPINIYPYAWNNAGQDHRSECWAGAAGFNSQKCKDGVTTDETYAITYWSHSWSSDSSKTHDAAQMEALEKGMNAD